MKVKIICISLTILFVAWIARFFYFNNTSEKPVVKTYPMNERVYFEEDFFIMSDRNSKGYSIKANSYELINFQDFAQKHNLQAKEISSEKAKAIESFRPDYIFALTVTIFNEDGVENGIDLFNTLLVSENIRLPINEELWELLYPQLNGSYTFALRENSDKEFVIPFAVETPWEEKHITFSNLNSYSFYLGLSQYPVKKIIEIR